MSEAKFPNPAPAIQLITVLVASTGLAIAAPPERSTNILVPESEYKLGTKIAEDDEAITWGEPNENGLRLGLSGIEAKNPHPIGKDIDLKMFIRNDGKEPVKVHPTALFGLGLNTTLTDEHGKKFPLLKKNPDIHSLEYRYRLDPGHQMEPQKSPFEIIYALKNGSPATRRVREGYGFVITPGTYTLDFAYDVGMAHLVAEGRDIERRSLPGVGEWSGTLVAKPVKIEFAPPTIRTAKPGDTAIFNKRHRLHFQKGTIRHFYLAPRSSTTWIPSSFDGDRHPWKTADPSGEYLAAWDDGGTRLWYVDGTGIQFLEFNIGQVDENRRTLGLVDRGHWKLDEAKTSDLGEMPDGVRKALKLPASP